MLAAMTGEQDLLPKDLERTHRDRSGALVAAGLVVVIVGLGCAALVPLTILASVLSYGGVEPRSTIAVSAFYAVVAAAFVWLGVGAVRARRWARDLMLSVSRIWLLTGTCTLLLGALVLPGLVRASVAPAGLPPAVATTAVVVILVGVALSQVLLPAALLLFFRSPEVAATCRARSPEPQFTDSCPERVLTLTVVWALTGASVLVVPAYDFAFPFFGCLLQGAAGALPWALVLAACGALAWGSCRRAPWAWWAGIAATVAAALATVLTTLAVGPERLVRVLETGAARGGPSASLPTPPTWAMVAGWLVVWGSLLVYLWSLRSYFRAPGAAADA
jgi:hypothetical protein